MKKGWETNRYTHIKTSTAEGGDKNSVPQKLKGESFGGGGVRAVSKDVDR